MSVPIKYRALRRIAVDAFEMARGNRENYIANFKKNQQIWLQFFDFWASNNITHPTAHVEDKPIFDIEKVDFDDSIANDDSGSGGSGDRGNESSQDAEIGTQGQDEVPKTSE